MTQKKSSERLVRDIKRNTRRKFSSEKKIRIVFKWPDQSVYGLSAVLAIDPWFFLLAFILLSVYTFGKQRELPF